MGGVRKVDDVTVGIIAASEVLSGGGGFTVAYRSHTNGPGDTAGNLVTPGTPSGLVNGDGVLICVVHKGAGGVTGNPVTPTSWTKVAESYGGGGSAGAGSGPSGVTWYFREKTAAWSTVPTVSIPQGNASMALALAYSKTGGAWSVAGGGATYGVSFLENNPVTTLASNPGVMAGDVCVAAFSAQAQSRLFSSFSISAPGLTVAAATTRQDGTLFNTGVGADVSGGVGDATVTAGVATGAPSVSVSINSSSRGAMAMVRLRAA